MLSAMTSQDRLTGAQSEAVDRGLVAMFLRMSPEERIVANDKTLRTISELRDAFTQRRKETSGRGFERTA
jgi:hypothetical protein